MNTSPDALQEMPMKGGLCEPASGQLAPGARYSSGVMFALPVADGVDRVGEEAQFAMIAGSELRIFVSYSRCDLVWRDRIVRCLREMVTYRNASVFVDDDVPSGDLWKDKLREQIESAGVVLFLVSKAWLASENCRAELNWSFELSQAKQPNGSSPARQPLRILWVPLDTTDPTAIPKELLEINCPVGTRAALNELRDERALQATLQEIAGKVLAQIDPLWDRLQGRLPSKYRLIRRLGGGSAAAVYLAGDLSLGRRVAIRAVRDPADNDAFDAAVHRAVRVGRHAVLPSVLGAWLEADPHCCVLDYLEGKPLASLLEKPMLEGSVTEALRLLLQLGDALVEIHHRGVHLHNLRPSNILIDDNGDAFICGLSKADSSSGQQLDCLSEEELAYLPPEHVYPLGDVQVGEKTDQYLLGLIGYQVLTRKLPKTVTRVGTQLRFHVLEPIAQPSELVSGCPQALSAAVARMTNLDPGERYPRLSEALEALRDLQPVDLTLARESFARCMRDAEAAQDFFATLYAAFRAQAPGAEPMFRQFEGKQGGWTRLHELLRDAILMLFAYSRIPPSDRREPNLLTRIAQLHGRNGRLKVESVWYDVFASVLVETAGTKDPACKDERARLHVTFAWQCALAPGIRYMKRYSDPAYQELESAV